MNNRLIHFSPITILLFLLVSGTSVFEASASGSKQMEQVYEGTIQVMVHCDIDGTTEQQDFLVVNTNGETWLQMTYPSPEARVAITADGNTMAVDAVFGEVKVTGTLDGYELMVRRIDVPPSEIHPSGQGTLGLGEASLAAVLIGFSGNPNTFDKDEVWDAVFGEGRSMQSFYQEASFGGFKLVGIENPEGDVLGPFNLSYSGCSAAGGYPNAGSAARDAARDAGHPIDDYDKVLHIFVTGGDGCPGGGVAGGRYANVFVNLRSVWDFGAHETAHCFGLGHASSSTDCSSRNGDVITYGGNCGHDEYGDQSDIMGGRNFMFCSYHMERLGWLPEDNATTVEKSERVVLWPINHAVEGIQSLYAASNDNLFHFEFRRQEGFDEGIEDGLVDGILVRTVQRGRGNPHIIDMTPQNNFRDAALREGSTFKDDGLEVTTVEVTDEYAVVDVIINGEVVSARHEPSNKRGLLETKKHSFTISGNGMQYVINLPLNEAGSVRNVSIVDLGGHQVRKLDLTGGNLVWNGLTEKGTAVRPGVYMLRFECDTATFSTTAVLTR